jgi:hypothetical protein
MLYAHPALNWTPPLWRSPDETCEQGSLTARHAVRAVERNLLVQILAGTDGRVEVQLSTGPLADRPLGDGIDPVTPAALRDERLDVRAYTFEDAVCELARRVLSVYGPADAQTL